VPKPAGEYRRTHPQANSETLEELTKTGRERPLVCRVMAYAGLRTNEARTLTWSALDLAADPPTLTVEAKYAKSKRQDVAALHSAITSRLRERRAAIPRDGGLASPADRVFHNRICSAAHFLDGGLKEG